MSGAKQGDDMKRAIERVSGSDCRCVGVSNNGDEGISTSVEMRGNERASASDRNKGNDRTRVNVSADGLFDSLVDLLA